MKVLAFNGSPRKQWNTAKLLEKALEGAASVGAETELIHLYDLNYKGCTSCFACKQPGSSSYGRCAIEDDLYSIFTKIEHAQAIILGSPIYFGSLSGEMRSFMERLMFPYITYTNPPQSLFPGKLRTGCIYTMNAGEEKVAQLGYKHHLGLHELILHILFGSSPKKLYCYDTYQFEDYSKMRMELYDKELKDQRRSEVFPLDLEKAFALGVRLVGQDVKTA